MQSIVKQLCNVSFPIHTMERVYMQEFYKEKGLPDNLSRWQHTVDSMLQDVDTDGPIYIMIDQGIVKAGSSHRRPGVHIDGYWVPQMQCHSGPGGHIHAKNKGYWDGDYWKHSKLDWPDEAIILASDVKACAAYSGSWEGEIGEGGDCSSVDVSKLNRVELLPNVVYAGNVTMLHESLPISTDVLRTLVRLNVPGWSPKEA